MSAAFMALFFALWMTRVQTEVWRQRARARRLGVVLFHEERQRD